MTLTENPTEPFEYLSHIEYLGSHDMTRYVKHAGCISIFNLKHDLDINCLCEEILINFK